MASSVSERDESYEAVSPNSARPRSIAVYLFVLALVALVPAFVFSAILLQRNNDAQGRVVETLMTGSAASLLEAVDREITANITTLKVLATSNTLLEGDLPGFYNRVKAALDGTGSFLYVLDENLMTVLSTRVAMGSPPIPTADPQSARRAFERRDIVVSDLVFGSVSQRWVYNILLPISLPGQGPHIIALNRDAGNLGSALLANKLPQGWNVALVDTSGRIIAASPGGGQTGGEFNLAPEALHGAEGWMPVEFGGEQYMAATQRSPITGWTLVTWAPEALVTRPLSDAVWSLMVGGVLLAALVILVVYWVSLQIGRSVHGLEADAKRLGAGESVPVRAYPISEIATVSGAIGDASRQRQAAEAEVRFLMRELAHRSKNQMTVIAAMAKQTAKGADSVPEFVSSFEKRIFGLARSTDLLLANGVAGIDLRELLAGQINPFCPTDSNRVQMTGPAIRLNAQSAQIIGMAAHEMATNAVKYGAFSRDGGIVRIAWARRGDRMDLVWREIVPGAISRPERRGFGTVVLENMVGRALGATVTRTDHPDGIEWSFDIPAEGLDPANAPQDVPGAPAPAAPAPAPEATQAP